MKTVTAQLRSIAPYSQSKHYVDPPKGKNESPKDYEIRTWRERMHATEEGNVFIPGTQLKNCLADAAKYLSVQIPGKGKSTYTKHIEAGILVIENIVLPDKKAEVPGEWLYLPSDGKRGGSKRVDRCFGVIHEWSGSAQFIVLDETVLQTITIADREMTAFEYHLREAGSFIGIGRFRPRNNGFYGRFVVDSLSVA